MKKTILALSSFLILFSFNTKAQSKKKKTLMTQECVEKAKQKYGQLPDFEIKTGEVEKVGKTTKLANLHYEPSARYYTNVSFSSDEIEIQHCDCLFNRRGKFLTTMEDIKTPNDKP